MVGRIEKLLCAAVLRRKAQRYQRVGLRLAAMGSRRLSLLFMEHALTLRRPATRHESRIHMIINLKPSEFEKRFRFLPTDFNRLHRALQLPDNIKARGYIMPSRTCLLMFLHNLTVNTYLLKLALEFGMSTSACSSLLSCLYKIIDTRWG
jgi:hypothetical protein